MKRYMAMLEYMRPDGSNAQRNFCKRFLEPSFGKPDQFGNYMTVIGDSGVAFMAHHDTVHCADGLQRVEVAGDLARLPQGSESGCLGADCTSGIWLILEMIDAGVQGRYIIHAGEEIGCVGSRALVDSKPAWLDSTYAAISFDRRGYDSIVTHQMGLRTCSDDFAYSLADALCLDMKPDDSGSYTDSNEYAHIVPECTNISVGYHAQHTGAETQDLPFMVALRDALITADFTSLVVRRDPALIEDDNWWYGGDTLESFIADNPEEIADLLRSYGHDLESVMFELTA